MGLILQQTNEGLLATDGIDFSLRYNGDLTDTIKFGYAIDGTWTNSNKFLASPGGDNRECVGFFSVNCGSIQPEFSMSNRFTFTFDEIYNLSLRHRFISSVQQEPLDIIENGEAFIGISPLFGQVDFTRIPAENYFDLSGQWDISDNVAFTGNRSEPV
ncbi:MAG: hypothetical protein U5J78_06915 [Parasphingorhabdus sp.]|nr:hypothetical protein [Parasphingorhabdus sp.]